MNADNPRKRIKPHTPEPYKRSTEHNKTADIANKDKADRTNKA